MKLYYVGHDCLFAVEQMMFAPRKETFRGNPSDFTSSGEMNSPCGKVLPIGQNAWYAPLGATVNIISEKRGAMVA